MELNPRIKSHKKEVINEEGSLVLNRSPEIQLYLEASNLNLKKNSFYKKADGKLNDLLALADKQDKGYVLGLAKFLADKGLKTSPVILLSALSNKKMPFTSENLSHIFNTPKRIAEAFALQDMKLVKLNESFKDHVLRNSLQEMKSHTLLKGKMKRNKIKLRDLIKRLRPKPVNGEMDRLYKNIIQNRKVGLAESGSNMIAIKSSTKLSQEEKKEEIEKNIDNIPVNQLIRNLKFLAEEYDFEKNLEVQKKVITKLKSINNYRFLNIFDVITAAIYVPQFEKLLDEIVKGFINNVEFKYDGKATVLFDTSGSMLGVRGKDALHTGFLYLVLFAKLFNVKLFCFDDKVHPKSKDLDEVLKLLQKGSYQKAYNLFNTYAHSNTGGTALLDSATTLLGSGDVETNFIVISDEVSWKEGDNLLGRIDDLSKKVQDKNLIVINPSVSVGTVFKKNVLAVSSLNPSILIDMAILVDEEGFIKYVKNYKKNNITEQQ